MNNVASSLNTYLFAHPPRPARLYLLVLIFASGVLLNPGLKAQCADGTEPECECSTAPVLCTIDELDGYMFSMTNYQHPQDAPQPLCPPPEGNGTVPNNPTWFAFIAWCTSLTLEVHVSNCHPHQQGIIGVQIAIYSNCTTYTNVACDANSSDCDETDRTISMNNLIIGNTYYFMIDGCLGSYCDVTIDVIGVCGEEVIEDWTESIEGPTEICAGDTEVHIAEDLNGATDYHWYIDGVLVTQGHGSHAVKFNTTKNKIQGPGGDDCVHFIRRQRFIAVF